MKNLKTIAIALLVAFGTVTATAQKDINVKKSNVAWVGKKITGEHSGVVNLKSGSLMYNGTKLAAGSFVVDMQSVQVTDLKAGEGKEKLEGHLKSDDFFSTEKHPTAELSFKNVTSKGGNKYTVNGFLSIKGITNPITFDMVLTPNGATADLSIDRTKYDIKYNSASIFSGIGDRAIADEFQVKVNLVF